MSCLTQSCKGVPWAHRWTPGCQLPCRPCIKVSLLFQNILPVHALRVTFSYPRPLTTWIQSWVCGFLHSPLPSRPHTTWVQLPLIEKNPEWRIPEASIQ